MIMRDLAVSITIAFLVQVVWCGLEMLLYGEIQTRKVDSIIAVILTLSLYINYRQYQERRR